ncbi:MAG TPA: type II toxin-antitoxin system VapC family toxin [Rhodothermales bacterium]|nr:type II toxin-antitoxin system VapC family toxin [Rhodothermales bacterium]
MYLLDTFALIALLSAPDRLKSDAYDMLTDSAQRVYFSPASIWEIEIKVKIGKLVRPAADVIHAARRQGYEDLPVIAEHAAAAGRLPMHHRDPFDRLLIAQALHEGFTVATADPRFASYGVPIIYC